MSFDELKNIAEQSEQAAMGQRYTPGRNVALRVIEYNLVKKTVIGTNLLNGEVEEISLRPDKKERTYTRADVPEWSGNGKQGKRNRSYTEERGVILFESVFQYPDGLTAKWGTPYSHDQHEATVFVAPAIPIVSSKGKFGLEIVRVRSAMKITNLDELRSALTKALSPDTFSKALIRIQSNTGEVIALRDERGSLINRSRYVDKVLNSLSPEEAADDFINSKIGSTFKKYLTSENVAEVIPVMTVYAGKDTQKTLSEKAQSEKGDYFRFHKTKDGSVGFTETIIALRKHAEGGNYVSSEPVPTSTQPTLFRIQDLQTQHIRPTATPLVRASAAE